MTWAPVDVRLTTNSPREVNLPAFEIVDGGRFRPHRVGGGHWHVHGWRACDHVEAQPGLRTLIALDARGQIGLARLEVDAAEKSALVQTDIEPGSLLRIAFDGPEERARIALSSQGIEFRARDLPRGAVWYELAPAGEVSIRITSTMADPRSIEVDARAGRIERVEL